jgi:hypothetical protein
MGWMTRAIAVPFRAKERYSSLLPSAHTDSGAHPAHYSGSMRALSPKVKRSGRETKHSPTTNAHIQNTWSYTSFPQYAFMACTGKSQRLPLTFQAWIYTITTASPCAVLSNKYVSNPVVYKYRVTSTADIYKKPISMFDQAVMYVICTLGVLSSSPGRTTG